MYFSFYCLAWYRCSNRKSEQTKVHLCTLQDCPQGVIYKPKTTAQFSHHPRTKRGTPHHVPQPRSEWCTPHHSSHPRNERGIALHSPHPRIKRGRPLHSSHPKTERRTPHHLPHPRTKRGMSLHSPYPRTDLVLKRSGITFIKGTLGVWQC